MGRQKGSVGWWADHPFHKRSCSKDLKHFCGWNVLQNVVENIKDIPRILFLILFFTGGRANEVLSLVRENFVIGEKAIDVFGMVVLKKYKFILLNYPWEEEYLKEDYYPVYITEPITMTRNFPIRRDEPLVPYIEEYLNRLGEKEKLFPFKYDRAYRLIADIQKREGDNFGPWFPHRLRGERASQLVQDYRFTTRHLQKFFEWSADTTPLFYVKLSTEALKSAMGISGAVPEVYGVKEHPKKILGAKISPTLKVQKEEEPTLSDSEKKKKLKTSKSWFFSEYPEEE